MSVHDNVQDYCIVHFISNNLNVHFRNTFITLILRVTVQSVLCNNIIMCSTRKTLMSLCHVRQDCKNATFYRITENATGKKLSCFCDVNKFVIQICSVLY